MGNLIFKTEKQVKTEMEELIKTETQCGKDITIMGLHFQVIQDRYLFRDVDLRDKYCR